MRARAAVGIKARTMVAIILGDVGIKEWDTVLLL
jgi:hypothetical protein